MTITALTSYFMFVCALGGVDCKDIPITYEYFSPELKGMTLLFKDGRIKVGINRDLPAQSAQFTKETVTHEVAHILMIKNNKHRQRNPHGNAFKFYCGKLTREQGFRTNKICNEVSHGFR